MPLVALKCRKKWYPTGMSGLVYQLGSAMPELLTYNGRELYLDLGTPPEAVQVEFKEFGPFDINIPDVWIFIHFTEDPEALTDSQRKDVRDKIIERVQGYLREPAGKWLGALAVTGELPADADKPTFAIDIFWGPGHGCMLDPNGSTTLEW